MVDRGGDVELELVAVADRAAAGDAALAGVAIDGAATLRDGALVALELAARAGRLAIGGVEVTELEIEASTDGDRFPVSASGQLEVAGRRAAITARGAIGQGPEGWVAAIDRSTAALGPAALARGPVRLREVSGNLAASGRWTGRGLELEVAAGASLRAASVDVDGGALRVSGGERLSLEATRPVSVRAGDGGWSLSAPAIALRASDLDVAAGPARGRVSLELAAAAAIDGAGPRVSVAGGHLRARGLRAGDARIGAVDLAVTGGELAAGAASIAAVASRAIAIAGPVDARIRALGLEARAELDGGDVTAIRGELSAIASGRRGRGSVERLSLRLPLRWTPGGGLAGRGRVSATGARWAGHPLPRIAGTLSTAGRGWRFVGTAPISPVSTASIRATTRGLGLAGARLAIGAVDATVASDAGLGALIAELSGVAIDGRVGLDVAIEASGGRAAVTLREVDVVRGGLAFSGVRGRVALDDLFALRSPPDQLLRWRSLKIGEHQLGLGSLRFRLAGRRLAVDRAALRVGAGLIDSAPFAVDVLAPVLRLDLELAAVDLATWLPVVSRGRIHGEGSIDGRIDAVIRARPQWSVTVGTGRLVASGPGRLRFRDPAVVDGMLRDLARADRNSASFGALVRQRLVASLVDFDFSELSVEFFEDPRRPEMRAHLRGRGHRIEQAVDLTVNVRGVEDLLNPTLRGWLLR